METITDMLAIMIFNIVLTGFIVGGICLVFNMIKKGKKEELIITFVYVLFVFSAGISIPYVFNLLFSN